MGRQRGISFIGMPGAGKSIIGKQLADLLGWDFVDLDDLIREKEGQSLIEIIQERGERGFVELEEAYALGLDLADTVFAPGGSVVYSSRAMDKLQSETDVIYLDWPLEEIKKHLGENLETRGIIGLMLKGLDNLYKERVLLCQKMAHRTIQCLDKTEDEIVSGVYKSIFV